MIRINTMDLKVLIINISIISVNINVNLGRNPKFNDLVAHYFGLRCCSNNLKIDFPKKQDVPLHLWVHGGQSNQPSRLLVTGSRLVRCWTRLSVGMSWDWMTRWSRQRANQRYKDHLDEQLTRFRPIGCFVLLPRQFYLAQIRSRNIFVHKILT